MASRPHIGLSVPVSITEFLVAFGLGASEALHRPEHTKPGFGTRLVALLRRLSLDVGPLSANVSPDAVSVGALGATLEVDIQRELDSSRPFVENVGPALGRLLAPHAEDPRSRGLPMSAVPSSSAHRYGPTCCGD